MRELEAYVREVVTWFNQNKVRFALIGGIAVSFRTIERTTKDVDFAVAVNTDQEAEDCVRSLQTLGYRVETVLEQADQERFEALR